MEYPQKTASYSILLSEGKVNYIIIIDSELRCIIQCATNISDVKYTPIMGSFWSDQVGSVFGKRLHGRTHSFRAHKYFNPNLLCDLNYAPNQLLALPAVHPRSSSGNEINNVRTRSGTWRNWVVPPLSVNFLSISFHNVRVLFPFRVKFLWPYSIPFFLYDICEWLSDKWKLISPKN